MLIMPSVATPSLVTVPYSLFAFHNTASHLTVAYIVGGANTVIGTVTVTVTGPDTVTGATAMTGAGTVHWY